MSRYIYIREEYYGSEGVLDSVEPVIDVKCRLYCSEGKNLPQLSMHLAKLM
jgi:hypothetical protein